MQFVPYRRCILIEHEETIYTLNFITGRPKRYNSKGYYWPVVTQCVIKKEGLIIGIGEVAKHEKDEHNKNYAEVYSAKKAFKNAGFKMWKELRARFWAKILKRED